MGQEGMEWHTIGMLVVVGVMWGCTNPFLNKASTEQKEKVEWWNILSLITNWHFTVPFLLNQLGSVLFMYMLGQTKMSLVVPIANAITILFTAIVSRALGERSLTLGNNQYYQNFYYLSLIS
jgi:Putative transmembrane family 234